MKRRWALVRAETIMTVVEQDSQPQTEGNWQEVLGSFGPGDAALDGLMFRAGSPELAAYLSERELHQKGGT